MPLAACSEAALPGFLPSHLADNGRRFAPSSPPRVAGAGGLAGELGHEVPSEGFSPGCLDSTLEGHLMDVGCARVGWPWGDLRSWSYFSRLPGRSPCRLRVSLISCILSFFLVFGFFFKNTPVIRMDARFLLWISHHLFGRITGCSRTNYGSIRTNYGRYPHPYSDKLRALSTDGLKKCTCYPQKIQRRGVFVWPFSRTCCIECLIKVPFSKPKG